MFRRNIRLRKEYLNARHLESQLEETKEKKRKLKTHLDDETAIPSEFRFEAQKLRSGIDLEDKESTKKKNRIDSEYEFAGRSDPLVCITTGRDPSSSTVNFCKELKLVIPNSVVINRGNLSVDKLVELSQQKEVTDVIEVTGSDANGNPTGLIVSHMPLGPTAYFNVSEVVLRHHMATKPRNMPEAAPHLVVHNMESKLGQRIGEILKHLFPPMTPSTDPFSTQRVVTFANAGDSIKFRNHYYTDEKKVIKRQSEGAFDNMTLEQREEKMGKDIVLEELGPRFTLTPYKVIRGTLDTKDPESEWVKAHFINRRREALK